MSVSIPRAYKRNAQTKLLWLYKTSVISYIQYCNASKKLVQSKGGICL